MSIDVILLSAGYGHRYKTGQVITYKPLLKIGGKEICNYTLDFFSRNTNTGKIIMVVPKEQVGIYRELVKETVKKEIIIVVGGRTRRESVYNGLKEVTSDKVIIHDIIRPFINNQMVKDLINGLKTFDSVSTAIPSINTIVYTDGQIVNEMPKRENMYELQTPQAFDTKRLIEAHKYAIKSGEIYTTEDTRLMNNINCRTMLIQGSPENIKITYEIDLALAKILLEKRGNERKLIDINAIKEEFKKGNPIILIDDERRENEGDLLIPAELVTPEILNFMISKCRGLICVPLSPEIFERLGLELMQDNSLPDCSHDCASCGHCVATPLFTKSIDSKETETGISVYDRYLTIKKTLDSSATANDFICPGHIFPLMARWEGLKARQGHTEGAVDLCKILGYKPVAVICEIIKDNGEMARLADLQDFAQENRLKISSIEIIQEYMGKSMGRGN